MKTLLLFLFSLLLVPSFSQTFLNEQFNYGTTADTLCGTGGITSNWTPHSNAGTTPVMYSTTNLTYSGYSQNITASGSLNFSNGTGTRESVNRQLPARSSDSVYVSFLFRTSNGSGSNTLSEYFMFFNDTFGNNIGSTEIGRLFIQNVMLVPQIKLGLSKGSGSSGAVFTSSNYSLGTTLLLVLKYVFRPGSNTNDNVYAWVFTSGVPTTEPAPTLTATDNANDITRIRSLCVRQGTTISTGVLLDAIRVGDSWGNTVLPVSLMDFSAKRIQNHVLLNWQTSSEVNNSHFEVERMIDQNNWSIIGQVKGNGTTNTISTYQFVDDLSGMIPAGTAYEVYYRLKQVDLDGAIRYSEIITANPDKSTEGVLLFPNPFTGNVTLQLFQDSRVELYDISGKTIRDFSCKAGENILDMSSYIPGLYYLRASGVYHKLFKSN